LIFNSDFVGQFLTDFNNFQEKFALASGEEANNREKTREFYYPEDYYKLD